ARRRLDTLKLRRSCKEQAENRETKPAIVSHSRRLVFAPAPPLGLPKCAARPGPHTEEHRSARGRPLRQPPLRCDASRSMRGIAAHPSRPPPPPPHFRHPFP